MTLKINNKVEVVIPGIEYKIATKDGREFYITFLHKRSDGVIVDGTTNEDILSVIIDRIEKQNGKKSDRFNNKILFHLREAQRFLEDRSFYFKNLTKEKKQLLNNNKNEKS